ncbi:sigma-54-dependent transcriptional regulator [Desulfopila aestuarii]|uniref:DNA-binding transcriptional response regulator, NtrC family, contains REC, AAA-type ATPase, and a Fis-type DNA-binding domains n=1 Tax=Desulfopila aestuarii DSM 18488 TaxID=1121416 RepID=A0A1M7YKM8_9BACT|nr:sigma-54 dependent transcriptional regulator [Desulfopila aestuarii]SHO53142.1 DNA-binding transcriptional response regulator, NtrC family, contains REC, AAA-type ATPase, and a Fis-type DNA-binding domains [Desulfopila aestuarii DSM 18488]
MYAILMFDSCEQTRNDMATALSHRCRLTCSTGMKELQAELDVRQYDLVLLDVDAGGENALKLLEEIHGKNPYLPIIITSKSEKAEIIVEAMNRGASDFLVHPISRERIYIAVDKAIELRDNRNEIAYHRHLQDVVYDFGDVIAESEVMKKIMVSLQRFAATDSTILITGDTGTGKSFLSGTVHFNSPRRKKPFVKINCANIPVDLLESELFGHEKGAFTGADKQRIGRFEQASGGTIFLDEIGEMTMGLQTKLLRVLEEKCFERVGGNKTIYSDVRIIAATNKDLVGQVEKGLFREDLYYRINVLPIRLPSLRERPECLLPLANLLLKKYCKSMRRNIQGFSEAVEKRIEDYDWPGNIRQLSNAIERAVILEDSPIIRSASLALPEVVRRRPIEKILEKEVIENDSEQSLMEHERRLIVAALEESLWVQKIAAKKLGITPRSLNYKIGKLGITHPHWRRNS